MDIKEIKDSIVGLFVGFMVNILPLLPIVIISKYINSVVLKIFVLIIYSLFINFKILNWELAIKSLSVSCINILLLVTLSVMFFCSKGFLFKDSLGYIFTNPKELILLFNTELTIANFVHMILLAPSQSFVKT